MSRHDARRAAATQHVVFRCKGCNVALLRVRVKGRTEVQLGNLPAAAVALRKHRETTGCTGEAPKPPA